MSSHTSVHSLPDSEKFIDIEKILSRKNPALLKLLPKFVLKYIKRTAHQNELNNAIFRLKDKHGHDYVDAAIAEFEVKTKVIGAENIPLTGGVIMVGNHPLGGLDGVALMDVVGEYRKDIKFFVNDLLMVLKNFYPLFVPVNKIGRNSTKYIKGFDRWTQFKFFLLPCILA